MSPLKHGLRKLPHCGMPPFTLPLQQGLTGKSPVADEPFGVMLIGAADAGECLRVKAGILYAGMLGGCSCADDPTTLQSQPEYCELWFEIDRRSGATRVGLVSDGQSKGGRLS